MIVESTKSLLAFQLVQLAFHVDSISIPGILNPSLTDKDSMMTMMKLHLTRIQMKIQLTELIPKQRNNLYWQEKVLFGLKSKYKRPNIVQLISVSYKQTLA